MEDGGRRSPQPTQRYFALVAGGRGMTWTAEATEQAVKMWSEGHSASFIASRLSIHKTRNAVIGKLCRVGAVRKGASHRTNFTRVPTRTKALDAKRPRSAAPKKTTKRSPLTNLFFSAASTARPEPLPYPAPTDVARVAFADLEPHHCRFPVGDPREPDFGFCGDAKHDGLPYCTSHALRAYEAAQPRRIKPPAEPRAMSSRANLKEFA
jgi:GcrA cell cycle regulator